MLVCHQFITVESLVTQLSIGLLGTHSSKVFIKNIKWFICLSGSHVLKLLIFWQLYYILLYKKNPSVHGLPKLVANINSQFQHLVNTALVIILLPLKELRCLWFETAWHLLMHKYHHGLPNILDMFEQNLNIHQCNTHQSNLLHVPCCRTELGKKFFRYKAVIIWSEIYKKMFVLISKLVHLGNTWNPTYLTTQCKLWCMLIITVAAHNLALKKCQSVGCTSDICIDDRNQSFVYVIVTLKGVWLLLWDSNYINMYHTAIALHFCCG